eukprot:CAMPEP_0185726638 /NCGR_PEP_ID=MMETSP1171-20130828/2551_1 /TAXON_ID=374046 /ORGANISM="Helicotheca tamensis, Strain CCMP826" /LENGTH=364 /DNA_ID=CAMNT_0028395025 /DNA_START=231 /DNA_END=1325 /DNA_ORIENTATION=-
MPPPPSKPQYSPQNHLHPPPPQSLPNQSQQQCTYKIDLHGMKEQGALSSLSRFLEDCRNLYQKRLAKYAREGDGGLRRGEEEKWALVITGSGAHSPNGPVLRTAVQSLLIRRQMTYTLTKGRGSFLVDITTGIDFYASHSTPDTKVLVVSEHDPCALPLQKQKLPSPPKFTSQNSNVSKGGNGGGGDDDPLPSEVLQNEEELRKAKQLSSLSYNTSRGLAQKDIVNLDNAIKESEALAREDTLQCQKEEEEYRKVLELSTKEQTEEEEELQRILELSKLDCCTERCREEEEDEEMKRVLALSLEQNENEEEGFMMKQALQQSLVLHEEDMNMMKEVMEMSLAAAAASAAVTDYPNDGDVGACGK